MICNPSKCVKQSTLNINGYLPRLGFGKTKGGWQGPNPALDAEGRLSTVYKHKGWTPRERITNFRTGTVTILHKYIILINI